MTIGQPRAENRPPPYARFGQSPRAALAGLLLGMKLAQFGRPVKTLPELARAWE